MILLLNLLKQILENRFNENFFSSQKSSKKGKTWQMATLVELVNFTHQWWDLLLKVHTEKQIFELFITILFYSWGFCFF